MNNLSTIARNVGAGELIDFFIREFPHIGRKIKQAKNAGHDIQDILNELQGLDKKELKAREKKASLVDKGNNALISASDYSRENSAQQRNVLTPKNVGIAGMGALAATALSPLVSTAASSLISDAPEQPTPTQPLQPGPELGQQINDQAQAPVTQAMQPSQPGQIAQAAQAIPSQPEQQQSIFQQITAGIDTANLEPAKQQQLQFLNMISDDFEAKGKTLNDPEMQKLSKKIKDVLKGNPGTVIREGARFQEGEQSKSKTALQLNSEIKQEKRIDPDDKYPKTFFKGKKKEEIDNFANDRIQEAFSEIEKGIAEGQDYGVFHGDEWQAVGNKDVNQGAPNAPNERRRNVQPGKKLIQVIEEHVPTRGLYQYYFDTAEKKKRMPFNKFSRGYEKTVEEMIIKKTNPEFYAKQEQKEKEFLSSIAKNQMPDNDLFDEIEKDIEDMLFGRYDDDYEDYLTRMVKKIR